MRTLYTELTGRRARISGNTAWTGRGNLVLRINPALAWRRIYAAVLFSGYSGITAQAQLALTHQGSTVWQATGSWKDMWNGTSYTGATSGWDTPVPSGHYAASAVETGWPPFTVIASAQSMRPQPAAGADTLCWETTVNTGYGPGKYVITAWPIEAIAVADRLELKWLTGSYQLAASNASVEVFLACRSTTLWR